MNDIYVIRGEINGQSVHRRATLTMNATSAETNVVSISSYLGLSVRKVFDYAEQNYIKDIPLVYVLMSLLQKKKFTILAIQFWDCGRTRVSLCRGEI
jgi:hypothetical protein